MKRLARLFGRGAAEGGTPPPEDPPPRPGRLTYAVGDIHGRLDLLDALLPRIGEDAGGRPHDIVFLGDYVDRGPDSAGVLRRLRALDAVQAPARGIVCLMGNHDYMMLHYLAAPGDGVNWLLAGGRDTLASFGVGEVRLDPSASREGSVADRIAAQAAALGRALGPELADWLARRPFWWQTGDLVAVHALTDPALPMAEQQDEVLIWARPGADLAPRHDGTWVVHGHTIVPRPTLRARHIDIDTGAFQPGRPLTAAAFEPGEPPRFLQVVGA